MKIEFNDTEYMKAYGHNPKGRGTWWFNIFGEQYQAGCLKTLTEAKKEVREHIKNTRPDVDTTLTVYILP